MKKISFNIKKLTRRLPLGRRNRLKRSPKIFIPVPRHWIVIPFKPLSVVIILVLLAVSVYLILRSDIFIVRDFTLTGNPASSISVISSKEIEEFLQPYVTHSTITLKVNQIEEGLQQEFTALKNVQIERQFPDHLTVTWWECEPAALIEIDGSYRLVDENGLLYAQVNPEEVSEVEVPRLQGDFNQTLKIGEQIEGQLIEKTLTALKALTPQEGFEVTKAKIVWADKVLYFNFQGGWEAIFDLDKDINQQTQALINIVSQCEKKGQDFHQVDLRYKMPVLR